MNTSHPIDSIHPRQIRCHQDSRADPSFLRGGDLGDFDAMFWRERFRSLLGRVEADVLRTLPCREATVLGHVCEGELPVHAADPGRTARSYRVNPNIDLRRVLLDPVKSKPERLALRLLTNMHLHGTVTAVTYLE